jgi:hypothetical protein
MAGQAVPGRRDGKLGAQSQILLEPLARDAEKHEIGDRREDGQARQQRKQKAGGSSHARSVACSNCISNY